MQSGNQPQAAPEEQIDESFTTALRELLHDLYGNEIPAEELEKFAKALASTWKNQPDLTPFAEMAGEGELSDNLDQATREKLTFKKAMPISKATLLAQLDYNLDLIAEQIRVNAAEGKVTTSNEPPPHGAKIKETSDFALQLEKTSNLSDYQKRSEIKRMLADGLVPSGLRAEFDEISKSRAPEQAVVPTVQPT